MQRARAHPWLAWLLIVAPTCGPAWGGIAVDHLCCEYRVDPLGIDVPAPRLSWIVKSAERAQRQTAYRVLVASSRENLAQDRGDLWDSGKVPSSDTLNVGYAGQPLISGQPCFWKVHVWDKNDAASGWSAPAVWEMALLGKDQWAGQWLNDGKANPRTDEEFYREDPAPVFRTAFVLAKPARRARLYITGLGYYEASLNGRRVGDQVLDPGWTKYDRRVFYSTYDVTQQLCAGTNCLGVMLGNGWYNPLPLRMWGHLNLREHLATGRPRFIAQLNVEFTDGSAQSVVSDRSWKVSDGPIRFNSIYRGEIYDARKEIPGWDQAGFDDAAWRTPGIAAEPIGTLQAQPQPPIRVTERFRAVSVAEPRAGVYIYDMGQNFSGWASFRFRAAAGASIELRYGELLHPDGTLNPMTSVCGQIKGRRKNKEGVEESVGGPGAPAIAWQSDTYIARGGGEESYTPRFTFHGFRYVEVGGLPGALPLEAVTGLRLNADLADAGSFVCSNEQFNRIQQMCRRTFLANVFSVQSDCPHRERMGYGGDIVATSEALMLNFDMSTFYAKAVQDWADGARPDGMFTDTAPFVGIQYCGVGWAMAHPLLLSQLHRYYGNKRLIEEQYEAARRWLLLVAGQNEDGVIKEGLSDHEGLAPAPAPAMVTPLYCESARILAALARVLHRGDDAERFDSLTEKIRQAYRRNFLDGATGKAGPGTQASQSFALYCDLVPEAGRAKTLDLLLEDIRGERTGHLSTGIMGTKFMLDVLSREGSAEVAYGIVNRTDFPGWGWMLEHGATTLWEHWAFDDRTFSHSHPMFGSVSQWFINWMGGIQPAPEAVGFDRVIIRPQTVRDVNWVRSSYGSVRGRIGSNWRREGGRLRLDVEIPANVTAEIWLPTEKADEVTEGGKPAAQAAGVEFLGTKRGVVVYRLGSGQYAFELTSPTAASVEPSSSAAPASAEMPADTSLLTVERIFAKEDFKTHEWGPARWLKDASGYTTLEKSETVEDGKDVVRYDPASGRREVLVLASNLIARGESKPLRIEDYAWSRDTTKLLIFTNTKRVWRKNTRGDYWVFDLKRGGLEKLGGEAAPSTLMFATLSPEGRRVAYVCENNIFVQSLDTLQITRLTADGSDSIINGTSDWVYEEEFLLQNGMRWSPDGKYIAYWQFDTSGVREFTLINNTDALYPEITSYAYPKVGEINSACRVGIVKASGGKTRWLRASDDPRNHYIPEMEWTEDSRHVVFQQLNRLQNMNQVIRGGPKKGDVEVLLTDRDDAWVEVVESWHWIDQGKRFLWLSERDGWQHLYAAACANQELTLLTPGAYDVISIVGVDAPRGLVYFMASPDNPTQRYLYRAPLDGRGEVRRVSPEDQPGAHSYQLSEDCRFAFHTYSRFGQPPRIELVRMPEHRVVRVLVDNAALRAKLAELKICPSEFFRVGLESGVELDAWCIRPPGFDPATRYPLVIYVYGEPAGTTVVDSWGGEVFLWHCLLAQQGYVVMSIDNRGTSAPRGREWRKSIYRQVGILASADQAAATRQILRERPYVDAARVGIWGWSGGGSMSLNAIFRYPELYRTAMAIAFVSNQRFYDTVYQERYMGLPADNAAGYKDGSPITFAHQLKGNLLLVYGTGDDNCHYQNCETLINELVKQKKQFSLMSYPNRTHAINEGENTKRHLFETLTRYLKENLPATQSP